MNCDWECLEEGCTCLNCDQKPLHRDFTGELPPVRECKARPVVYLADTILRGEHESAVELVRPICRHMGERTENRVKEKCGDQAGMLPVYRCAEFRLCSPFGNCVDAELVHPCPGCTAYVRQNR
jgi:hypothetical protein